ncbi:hypothetical protein [Maritimibacter sp. UBA3975]|uniref:hypothetical protein n=1 Tax=Maritimibacter sp. UBA3975 TaxID=1946833 RepID=UPI000C0B2065|nr:hypothetical protein [Maritimibacter sp. UBA3975]MAM60634.1 hypothetical protein [Maritimibacter sp.]|tara:strand:- start:4110 stop:4469 length:360 start_codon:yes stop_codon:yes gene_type:complete
MTRTAALLALAAPLAAHGEGARLALDCAGADDTARTFVFAPVEVDAEGIGRITVGEDARPGIAAGFFGPWSWTADKVRTTLMVNGDAGDDGVPMLLHELDTTTTPFTATLTELTCEAPF